MAIKSLQTFRLLTACSCLMERGQGRVSGLESSKQTDPVQRGRKGFALNMDHQEHTLHVRASIS